MLNIEVDKKKGKVVKQICHEMRRLIHEGTLKPGERLPSLAEMGELIKVHKNTVRMAFEDLIAEGWIESRERVGHHVSLEIPSDFFNSRLKSKNINTNQFEFSYRRLVRIPGFSPEHKIKYNFQSGLPDLRLVPKEEIKKYYNEAIRNMPLESFDYGSPLGHQSLIREIESYMRRMRQVNGKTIAITNGSQEALFIIAQILLGDGDEVVMEEVSYAPARAAFEMTGAKVVTVKTREKGPDLKELEKKFQRKKVKAIFLTPLHHFPTCGSIPIPKRYKIYELCEKYDVFIIEDDYDHEIHFTPPPAPMAADDPSDRIIYLSTLSKAVFPSIKIGFVAMPKALEEAFINYRRILTHQNERVSQEAMALYLRSGGLERHLRRVRRVYEKRRDTMVEFLNDLLAQNYDIDFKRPEGGLALWLDLKRDSTSYAKAAQKKGVFVLPESNYHFKGKEGTHLRLGYSNQNEEEILKGLKILKTIL